MTAFFCYELLEADQIDCCDPVRTTKAVFLSRSEQGCHGPAHPPSVTGTTENVMSYFVAEEHSQNDLDMQYLKTLYHMAWRFSQMAYI